MASSFLKSESSSLRPATGWVVTSKVAIGRVARLLLLAGILLPLWMWLAWRWTSRRKLVIAIIDKTVLTSQGQEHVSLNWVLNQEKFTRNNRDLYQRERDYFGFFPLDKERFREKGLERFSEEQLQQLSKDADAAYLTDAYGIYGNEWFHHKPEKERSGIVYGGLSPQDLYFLKQMQVRHKLIITEFNCLGSPTPDPLRNDFEKTFGVHWSGWIGRYFDSFDTTLNNELPHWLIDHYRQQHNGKWPFTRSGIAFVHRDDRIVVLEKETHLNKEFPYIFSGEEGQAHYGLPASTRYNYWFDIITVDTTFNHKLATFKIDANEKGLKEMNTYGIKNSFPAVVVHLGKDYRFFYFAGDFCDNPIGLTTSYFKGIRYFDWLLYNRHDAQERKGFFWKVYRPLVTSILNDYYPEGSRAHRGK